jgi:plasmid stabilization system protein ParE
MKYSFLFTKEASVDVESAFNWYEEQQVELGNKFLSDLNFTLEKLTNDKIEFQKYMGEIRKIRLQSFPFTIYFQKKSDDLLIVIGAVLHQKESFVKLHKRFKQ